MNRSTAFCVALFLSTASSSVRAAQVYLEERTCDHEQIDVGEVRRLIDLEERPESIDVVEQVDVKIECTDEHVSIRVVNKFSNASVHKMVHGVVDSRLIALIASQLIGTLREEEPSAETPATGETSADATRVKSVADLAASIGANENKRAAGSTPVRTESIPPLETLLIKKAVNPWDDHRNSAASIESDYSFGASGGTRFRNNLGLITGAGNLWGEVCLNDWLGLALLIALEGGIAKIFNSNSEIYEALILGIFVGTGPTFKLLSFKRYSIETMLGALLGGIFIDAWSGANNDLRGTNGVTGDFFLAATQRLRVSRSMLALEVKGGYAIENPIGTVSGYPEEKITLGGFWLGIDFKVGFLGPPRS